MSDNQLRPPDIELPELAERINTEYELCRKAAVTSFERAIEIGKVLQQAKEKVPYGTWMAWLAQNCSISDRSARPYMQIAKHPPRLATLANLTLKGALLESAVQSDLTVGEAHQFTDDEDGSGRTRKKKRKVSDNLARVWEYSSLDERVAFVKLKLPTLKVLVECAVEAETKARRIVKTEADAEDVAHGARIDARGEAYEARRRAHEEAKAAKEPD
jgi:hypothetical protein